MNANNHRIQRVLKALGRTGQAHSAPSSSPQNLRPENIDENTRLELLRKMGLRLVSQQPICSQIGVGVYQGEAVAIQRWGLGNQRPVWLVYKLLPEYLSRIPEQSPQELRYLSCILGEYYKQPDLVKNYLLTKGEETLGKCYQVFGQHEQPSHPFEAEQNMSAIGDLTLTTKAQEKSKLEVCSKCSLWQLYQSLPKESTEKQTKS